METEHPKAGVRIPALDGLRGVAIAAVFFFHSSAGKHATWWPVRLYSVVSRAGWVGVPLFFVLSGFLITGTLWDERDRPQNLQRFLLRRSFRIVPLYFTCLLMAVFASALAGSLQPALRNLWAPALFLQDFPGTPARCLQTLGPLPLFHLWSVAVEEHFYLLWPLLLLRQCNERQAMRLCGWVIAVSSCVRIAGVFHPALGLALPLVVSRSAELALGAAVALALRCGLLGLMRRWAAAVALGSLSLFVVCEMRGGLLEVVCATPVIALATAATVILALREGHVARGLSWQPIRLLGRLSYGVYLFHVPLAPLCDRVLQGLGVPGGIPLLAARIPVCAVATLAAAWLGHHWIERPAIRFGRALMTQKAPKASPPHRRARMTAPGYRPSFLTSSL